MSLDQVSFSCRLVSGQADHSLSHKGTRTHKETRVKGNSELQISFLSLESSVFSASCPSHGTLCSEMLILAGGKVGNMHVPKPKSETPSSATARTAHGHSAATGGLRTLRKGVSQGTRTGQQHSLESLKRLCNPSLILCLCIFNLL